MKKFNCDMCTAEMVQVSQSKSKKRYKIRRFVCPLCGFKKTIFGSGELDESYFLTMQSGIQTNYLNKNQKIENYESTTIN